MPTSTAEFAHPIERRRAAKKALGQGLSFRKAGAAAGVPTSTVHHWHKQGWLEALPDEEEVDASTSQAAGADYEPAEPSGLPESPEQAAQRAKEAKRPKSDQAAGVVVDESGMQEWYPRTPQGLQAFYRYVNALLTGARPDRALHAAQIIDPDFGLTEEQNTKLLDSLSKLVMAEGATSPVAVPAEQLRSIYDRYAMGDENVNALAQQVYDIHHQNYTEAINENLRRVGRPVVPTVNEPGPLASMRTRAAQRAQGIANTYNARLASTIGIEWLAQTKTLQAGDLPGHVFHGNQYGEGISAEHAAEHAAIEKEIRAVGHHRLATGVLHATAQVAQSINQHLYRQHGVASYNLEPERVYEHHLALHLGNERPVRAGEPAGHAFRGNRYTGGIPGEGKVTDDQVRQYQGLKANWSRVNNELLPLIHDPASPEAIAKLRELKDIAQRINHLNVDPGGAVGVGLPGGPHDIVIVGGGPGGLTAAVQAGTDGLDALLIERATLGGQSEASTRIENYPGFPVGVTGADLANNLSEQAQRLGAEVRLGVSVTGITTDPVTGDKMLTLSNGETVRGRSVILAGGLTMRSLDIPGANNVETSYGDADKLTGKGNVCVIGGSNGAAQAALGAAMTNDEVTLISRGPIERNMSEYQIQALRNNPRIRIVENDEIAGIDKNGNVQTKSGLTLPNMDAVGVFAGGVPSTGWLPSGVTRDEQGKVHVDGDLRTSMPDVYAIGDIRHGSIGRILTAASDGLVAERNVLLHLRSAQRSAMQRQNFLTQRSTMRRQKLIAGEPLPSDAPARNEFDDLLDRMFELDVENPYFTSLGDELTEDDGTHEVPVPNIHGGETEGHAFRGNRYTGGISGEGTTESERIAAPSHELVHRAQQGDKTALAALAGKGKLAEWVPKLTENGLLHTDDIESAVEALHYGFKVDLNQQWEVSTLMSALAHQALDAQHGGTPVNLEDVSLKGTNLFFHDPDLDIARVEMPQLTTGTPIPGSPADRAMKGETVSGVEVHKGEVDVSPGFGKWLESRGFTVNDHTVDASYLRATQREIDGHKVGGMMDHWDPQKAHPIWVSSDGYVLDGHHSWATQVGLAYRTGQTVKMPVRIVSSRITALLALAGKYAAGMGVPNKKLGAGETAGHAFRGNRYTGGIGGEGQQGAEGRGRNPGDAPVARWADPVDIGWHLTTTSVLTSEQRAVINHYGAPEREGIVSSLDVNELLRHGTPSADNSPEEVQHAIDVLDAAEQANVTTKDVTVFRGMSADELPANPVGATFTDKGFVTAASRGEPGGREGPSTAQEFASRFPASQFDTTMDEEPILRIRVPAGSHLVERGSHSPLRIETYHEAILARGSTFLVVSGPTRLPGTGRRPVYDVNLVGQP